jgi:hypothetical protein
MRYGTKAAVVMGILLPALETYRRGMATWATNFTTMFEDYLAGAVLLVGAWMVARRRANAVMFLLSVWGWVVGMILVSTFRDATQSATPNGR